MIIYKKTGDVLEYSKGPLDGVTEDITEAYEYPEEMRRCVGSFKTANCACLMTKSGYFISALCGGEDGFYVSKTGKHWFYPLDVWQLKPKVEAFLQQEVEFILNFIPEFNPCEDYDNN